MHFMSHLYTQVYRWHIWLLQGGSKLWSIFLKSAARIYATEKVYYNSESSTIWMSAPLPPFPSLAIYIYLWVCVVCSSHTKMTNTNSESATHLPETFLFPCKQQVLLQQYFHIGLNLYRGSWTDLKRTRKKSWHVIF